MANLGVHVYRQATAVSAPVVADVGIPFVVGLAPVHTASNPAKANVPVLCTSWDEAVKKLGFSYDWKTYTLCEFIYSHFQLYGCQPVIFCNVLDPEKMKKAGKETLYTPDSEVVAALPGTAILDTLKVNRPLAIPSNQTVKLRPAGPAGEQASFDYPAAYEAAGVTLEDNGIYYAGGKIAPELLRNGYAFVGLTFPKPDGAKAVTVTVDGKAGAEIDLAHDGDSVVGGEYIHYFAFAKEDGEVLGNGMWKLGFTWTLEDGKTVEEYCTIGRGQGNHCIPGEDYTAYYDEASGSAFLQIEPEGALDGQTEIICAVDTVDPGAVVLADIVEGVAQADACLTAVGVVPDLLCAPGWSHNPVIAAVMATKAAGINGLFRAKALIDCDSGEEGVREYSELPAYKNKNNFVDENQILCWPMVKLGDYPFHMSTQLAGLMASVDAGNAGIPYESPSNKCFQMDACCLEDGTEINLTWEQVNLIAGSWGVVTAINFLSMGWTAKGNYTACYPGNADVKDQFIPVSRMFDFVGNTLIRSFWSKLDKPMNGLLRDAVLDSCNIWLNGLVGSGYLLGARAEVLDSENPGTDLMAGIIHIHICITPPGPMQECDFTLEYDASYLTAAFQ